MVSEKAVCFSYPSNKIPYLLSCACLLLFACSSNELSPQNASLPDGGDGTTTVDGSIEADADIGGSTDADAGTDGSDAEVIAYDTCDGLEGSYDLNLGPASTRITMTLSGRKEGCEAVVTPLQNPSYLTIADIGAGEVVLRESCSEDDPESCSALMATGWYWGLGFFREYYWHQIVLPRKEEGGFEGSATAEVDVHWAEDDIASIDRITYSGSVAPDQTAPQLWAGPHLLEPPSLIPEYPEYSFSASGGKARPGQPEEMLPWDVLAVEASEPVKGLDAHLQMAAGENGSEAAAITGFAPAELLHGAHTQDTWSWTRFEDWDSVRGTNQKVVVEDGLVDAAGHAVESKILTVPVLDPGPALPEHDFQGDLTVLCYSECTLQPGQVEAVAPCNSGLGGVAGRLITEGAQAVKIRYNSFDAVLIDLFGRSGARYHRDYVRPDADGWVVLEIVIEDEPEVGFSITPNSLCHWSTHAAVVVDRVWAE